MIKKLSFFLSLYIFSASGFSQETTLIINDIQISGNLTTKENIITRELTFQRGDTILITNFEHQVERSRENILNTFLFNYVTITTSENFNSLINIFINVEERWYTWPSLLLLYDDRNFSSWLKSSDISKTKYGISVQRFNCFGRKETLKFSVLLGYTRQFSISYKNIALDKNRKHFIGADIEFSKQDEIIIDTKENKPITFKNSLSSVFERKKYTLNYLFRPQIDDLHNFYLNFFEYYAADTVIALNPDFIGKNANRLDCITLDYVFSSDRRDIKAYPLKGSYFEILIGQTLSIPLSKNSISSTVIIPSYYKYFKISNNFYYATGFNLKLSYTNTNSFIYSKSLGYNYNMHGFEYNTIEGQHLLIYKNLIKIAILKPKVTEISFIPLKKFNKIHYALYFNIFTDCGYVSNKYLNQTNSYANKFLFSSGAGLDLVTYYDRTLRAEYSINGFGYSGFYFHLTAPINK